eukprot:378579-Pelagomonas_calceolata.AAC.3
MRVHLSLGALTPGDWEVVRIASILLAPKPILSFEQRVRPTSQPTAPAQGAMAASLSSASPRRAALLPLCYGLGCYIAAVAAAAEDEQGLRRV